VYDSFEQLISVLARRNPRTPPDRLEFIARSWAREREDGRVELLADPKHKRTNPVLYQRDQAEACWRAITAPVLIVKGQESDILKRLAGEIDDARLREIFRAVTSVDVPGAGHMLHHERPEEVARIIEEFLR
jgi:pimeloyl-ACP methyl ester carboxylesterase